VYSEKLTNAARQAASANKGDLAPNGKNYNAQHIWLHLLVFINPTVASLPQHHHILSEHGCYSGKKEDGNYECGTKNNAKRVETPLPDDFLPLTLTTDMDAAWEKLVFGDVVKAEDEQTTDS
jgi:hypothetical protein